MPVPIIKVENLKVMYDKGLPAETLAVKGASFDVYKEEFVIIFGPSGCGKSTILYALAGIERRIEGGRILILGEDVTKMDEAGLVILHREKTGIIFQAYNLIPTLNVLNNVTLPLVAGGGEKEDREKKANMLLTRFGISQYADRFPQNLSGGQQQRVDIARALISDPEIILADEPTGNLDSKTADIVMNTLADLNEQEKKTIVLVTHDPAYLSYATKIIHMKDGFVTKEEVKEMSRVTRREDGLTGGEGVETGPLFTHGTEGKRVSLNITALSAYFDWRFDSKEEERMENIIRAYKTKDLSKDELVEYLDKPYRFGGMGLYSQKAKKLADEISEVALISESLEKLMKEKKDLSMKIKHITEWLLRDFGGKIEAEQEKKIEIAVTKRLKKEYSREEFQKYLDAPVSKGGVGLYWHTAKNLANKLEIILS